MCKLILSSFLLLIMITGCGGGSETPPLPSSPSLTNSSSGDSGSASPPTDSPQLSIETVIEADAARLLNQATFGATKQQIQAVSELGYEAWIDQQIGIPATSHLTHLDSLEIYLEEDQEFWHNHRMEAWWTIALEGEDQLRQRVAFALSEIMVISDKSTFSTDVRGITNYYDLLAQHAFGNYRDLLEAVTLSPIMGMYLSMLGNEKPDQARNIRPDENYARELMQLFSIGLVELNVDGSNKLTEQGNTIATYNQDIIKAYAHVFTGWHFNGTTEQTWWKWWDNYNTLEPMTAVEAYHDQGAKTLLSGVEAPPNQTAEQDLKMALDSLFNHPNVAPFISKQLIKKLVTSNPSPEYVARVSAVFNDNGSGVKGDLGAVIKAILLDQEARNGHISHPNTFGKIKEPLLKATQLWRALNAYSTSGRYEFGWPEWVFNQAPLSSPSVFNFFSPNYAPPGALANAGLVAPEMQITTENYVVRVSNFMAWSSLWGYESREEDDEARILIDLTDIVELAEDPEVTIEQLNLLLMAGQMSDQMQQVLLNAYNHEDARWMDDDERIANLVFLIITSPQYAVQR